MLIYSQNYSTKYYEIIDPSINKRGDFMYIDYAEIGRRIAQKRKNLQLTQAEVEERANLCPKYLSNIEHGRSIPSIDVLMQIADSLHTISDQLLLGAGSLQNVGLSDTTIENIRRLPSNKLVLLTNFVDWLNEQKI